VGIRDVSFDAADRAVTAVIGPNGAGKSVLFGAMAGLVPLDSGHIELTAGARVAYCPDVPQFESWLTAREVVDTSLAISGMRSGVGASEALHQCGLGKVQDRRVADFSRGMLQRLGIAAALVLDPAVLILDEPNSALDPLGRADIRELILEQKRERCVLLSSHLLSEVEQLADRIVVLGEGRIVSDSSTADLLLDAREPSWTIRLGAATDPRKERMSTAHRLHALRAAFPLAAFQHPSEELVNVSFDSFSDAEALLGVIIGAIDLPILEVTLQGRDLDSTFARILQRAER
jgi:ABC-2 type transport system ATP-binding protein